MQFSAAVLAFAATVSAAAYGGYSNSSVSYTTEVHTAYTTVCPEATQLSFNGVTYSVTEATTLVITNCPCTVVKPVVTSSVVYPTSAPAAPPVYANTTAPAAPPATSAPAASAPPASTPTYVPANGASQAIAFSGASLAGLLGLAVYLL